MNKNNFVLLLFSFVLATIFLTTPVFALTYRFDVDNGTWSQYDVDLVESAGQTSYNLPSLNQSFYNRDFETAFNVSSGSCDDYFCVEGGGSVSRTDTYKQEGSYSALLSGSGNHFFSDSEQAGDSNIVFWYRGNVSCGYVVEGSNSFVQVSNLSSVADWTQGSCLIPNGAKRWAFRNDTTTSYIDNVQVIRNHTGTFRVGDLSCSSLNSCSNIQSHLPSSHLDGFYWIVDYATGGSCVANINGNSGITMQEFSNGLYAVEVDEDLAVAFDTIDLSASCSKVPFLTKNFFVSPTIFKYGLLQGANFMEEFNMYHSLTDGVPQIDCDDSFCLMGVDSSARSTCSLSFASQSRFDNSGLNIIDGAFSGRVYSYVQGGRKSSNIGNMVNTSYVWGLETFEEGDTIYFYQNHTPVYVISCDRSYVEVGFMNDSNNFSSTRVLDGGSNLESVVVPAGGYNRLAFKVVSASRCSNISPPNSRGINFYFDVLTSDALKLGSSLVASNSLESNVGVVGDLVSFYSEYNDDDGNPILNADCEISVGGVPLSVSYNSSLGKYVGDYGFVSSGSYPITHYCSSENHSPQIENYDIDIDLPIENIVFFTPISNIESFDIEPTKVNFDISNNTEDIVFKVLAIETLSQTPFYFYNSRKDLNKNYFVYTSDDGEDWAIDETLTFGSISNDYIPIQKVWDVDNYKYEMYIDLLNDETKYYKLVYQDVGKAWETIRTSNDWVHYNTPTLATINNKSFDAFGVSELTELRSQLKLPFSNLLSGDFVRGVYVQFTAYATTDINVDVEMFGGTSGSGTGTVSVTTTPTRFSVLLNPMYSEEDVLRLLTDASTNSIVYITDYHIVPSSYFVDGMTVLNKDSSVLNAIVVEGVGSKQYIREGEPFRIKTSVYDRDGDLDRLEVRTFADVGTGLLIGLSSFDLADATRQGEYFVWDILVDGIIDLNGNYVNPSQLRDVYIHARLFNNDDEQVSQVSRMVSLLQYPYFPDDLKLSMSSLTNKYGESPSFYVQFENAVPDAFVGLRFVFHEAGQFDSPVYEKTIYADELNCNSLITCRKNLKFNEYVYNPTDALDYVSVEFLVNTEYPLSDDKASSFLDMQPLTRKTMPLILDFRQLETARVFQVYEREFNVYRHDEKIALVLQTRDIPFRDLTSVLNVELMFNVCDAETGGTCVLHDVNYSPNSTRYDATTGYSYHYFNTFVLDSAGNLLQDGNYLEPIVQINDLTGAMSGSVALVTHANKCQDASWGTAFNWLGFNMNVLHDMWDATQRSAFGCGDLTNPLVPLGSAHAQRLEVDTNHARIGGQNHSIICVNTTGKGYVSNLNQEMFCMVMFKQSDEQIDSFKFYISNQHSDFSRKSELEKQYIEIEIPAEKIIFEDMHLMAKTLEAEFQVDSIDTVGELAFYGFDKLFSGLANPFTDITTWTFAPTGVFTNVGWDWNWDRTFDPNFLNGVYWIKVEGLRVSNQQDYVSQYSELNGLPTTHFRRWVNQNNVFIPTQKDAQIWVLGSDFNPVLYFEPENNLVINAISSDFVQSQDVNQPASYRSSTQRFNFISDMLSDNFSKNERKYIPITFSYLVPPKPFDIFGFVGDVLFGETKEGHPIGAGHPIGLISNPTGFAIHNWFWIVILVVTLLVTSLIYKNFKGGGNISIYGNNQGVE